jgi:hypothetical protein
MLIKINLAPQKAGRVPGGKRPGDRWGGADVTEWIGATEAAQRLGIKPASLYSYVSRGVLSPRRGADGRASSPPPPPTAGPGAAGRAGRRAAPSW